MALMRRHGDVVRPDGSSGANELFTMGGHTGTHIDALCHVSHNGLLHGGADASGASVGGRFTVLGIETVHPIIGRGVLLNPPELNGDEPLPPAHAISAEELEETARHHAVEIRPHDTVLIRTGWSTGRYDDATAYAGWATGVPGPDESAARWLASAQVCATGSDTIAYEHLAPGSGHRLLPVHTLLLVGHGIHIIELLDLDELAHDRIREFIFVAIPLKLIGATGSPVRPLAVVPR